MAWRMEIRKDDPVPPGWYEAECRKVAEILRIPRSRAYALVQRGEIPSFKIGERSVRVHRLALDEYMQQTLEVVGS